MRVDTVGFISRIRLPDGRVETSISMQNQHQKIAYGITFDPKSSLVTITSNRVPYWTTIIPTTNCAFIQLGNPGVNTKKAKNEEPPSPIEEPPPQPVLNSAKRKMRPRPRKQGATL
jgi:hypothetical protein